MPIDTRSIRLTHSPVPSPKGRRPAAPCGQGHAHPLPRPLAQGRGVV